MASTHPTHNTANMAEETTCKKGKLLHKLNSGVGTEGSVWGGPGDVLYYAFVETPRVSVCLQEGAHPPPAPLPPQHGILA